MRKDRKKLFCYVCLVLALWILVYMVIPRGIFTAYFALAPIIDGQGDVFVTDDISDYGMITGNYDNETPQEFIQSFFPDSIDDEWSDVVYHYKAKKLDSYGYEAYLEFVVPDKETYYQLVDSVTHGAELTQFPYDQRYREYVVSDVFWISLWEKSQEWGIEKAQIGKVLFSDETQTVIFVAVGVYDGGGTRVKELSYFFSRFGIDPVECATKIF